MVFAPSSHVRPSAELLLIFPPALPSASKTVTLRPFDLSLYAAASPLNKFWKSQAQISHQEKKLKKLNCIGITKKMVKQISISNTLVLILNHACLHTACKV